MSTATTKAALAALSYWAARARSLDDVAWDSPEQRELVRHTAWLAQGKETPANADGWPELDLKRPLESIFSRVRPPERDGQPAPAAPIVYLRRTALAIDRRALFPVATREEATPIAESDPLAALAAVVADLAHQDLPPQAHLEGLLYALQRHAWCLPSPLEAVSLYDFARTHAALAAARAAGAGEMFLLGGDLSGVQSFLYTLTADGATKSLRGRSFYLQLLTEAGARYLLRRAGLPLTNLLYAGGGRFYALLPGLIEGAAVQEWLADQRAELGRFFLHQHQGELDLALGGDRLREADLLDQAAFSAAWGKATEAINSAKRRRFADLGAELAQVFDPQGHGGSEESACAVCGYQGDASELVSNPDEPQRCVLCDSFEDLGRLLHNAGYLLLRQSDRPAPQPRGQRQRWQELLSELGLHVQIAGPHAHPGERGNRHPGWPAGWTTVLALDDEAWARRDTALSAYPALDRPLIYGFRPVANTTPTMRREDLADWRPEEEGERPPRLDDVKPFSVMVTQSKGIKRLGVLRMDVDDLGDLFRYRLDGGLARVSALSAALALFFEGWVGRLCDQTNAEAGQRIYSIYSGGDDLFIVGSWHLLPELAWRIGSDLAEYTGHHPAVHLSAGISLHGAKFPLYQAADAAKEELDRAKRRPGKAALGWLEQVVAWPYFDELLQTSRALANVVKTGDSPRALLQTCQQLYVQYRETLRKGKLFYGPWLWRGVYQLARVAAGLRNTSARSLVGEVRKHLLAGVNEPPGEGARYIERLGLAARWAQLELRKERDDGPGE